MSSVPRPKSDSADRLALLNRGRQTRAVKRADAHIDTGPVELAAVPAPYEARGDGTLDDSERTDLKTCEQAVTHFQRALAVAGKALATIHAARLYRETHPTFEAYVEDRWGMKRAHAYRMVDGWPLAAALSPIGDTNEAQVRELVPVAKLHGLETATAVYSELKEHGGRVTAARIRDTVRALPKSLGSPEEARAAVRLAAAGQTGEPTSAAQTDEQLPDGRNPVAVLAGVADRQRRLYDELGGGLIAEALTADPGRAGDLLHTIAQYAGRTAHRVRTDRQK